MAKAYKKTAKKTWAFGVVVAIIAGLCGIQVAHAKLSGSLSEKAIKARLQPEGQVEVDGTVQVIESPASSKSGPQDIYSKNCAMCHKIGLAGAPKLGDKSAWAPRIKQGMDTLVKKAMTGFSAMPPKGNCLSCSEEDIRNTIQYMVDQL